MTMDIVNDNLDKSWSWIGINKNKNITLDIVEKNPDKPWNWSVLSENPIMVI